MAKDITFYNGMKMPIIGLGTFLSSNNDVGKAVEAALEAGYRHIDTAYAYQNEAEIGKVLKKWIDSKKVKREELFIVTKLPNCGNRAECVEKYLKRSLEALQLDYVDLYLIHSPVGFAEKEGDLYPRDESGNIILDMNTDHVSLWKAMEGQVDAGRTKSIGLSNFNSKQIARVVKNARIKPANLQVELHVYLQQRELAAFCKALDITLVAYAPIGSPGFFDFAQAIRKMDLVRIVPLEDPVVKKIALRQNKTPAQILLRHVIQRGIAVIPKSTNPERVKENFNIFDFELSADEVDELDNLDRRQKGRIFLMEKMIGKTHPELPTREPY